MESNIEKTKKELIHRLSHPSAEEVKKASYYYSLAQANVQRFLPKLNIDNFEELYKQYIYSQFLLVWDQYNFKKIDTLSVVNNSSFDILPSNLKEPTIFATFHYGSYRVLNTYLFKHGFKVVVIMDGFFSFKHKEEMEKLYLKYKEEGKKNNSDFIILSVNDLSIIPQLQKLLLDGYVLVVYVDGNTGSLKKKDFKKGWIEIDFLNSKINAKIGVAVLSMMLKASIIPIVTCWGEYEKLEMKFYPSISPNNYSNSKIYVKDAMMKLYSILEEHLYKNPAPWECWTYMHKWFEINDYFPYEAVDRKKLKYKFNRKRYSLFFLQDNYYFFDKFSYKAFPIDENLHNLMKEENINKIENSTLEDLINKNVII